MFYNFKIPFILLIATILSATAYAFATAHTVQNVLLIAMLWLGVFLAGLVITGIYACTTAEERQDALIHLKYGAMIVDIQWQNIKPTSPVIDITTIEDLARLAERHGTMILHMAFNALHYYLVQDNETTYRYVIEAREEGLVKSKPVHNEITRHVTYPEQKQVSGARSFRNKTQEYPAGQNAVSAIRFESLQNKMSRHPSVIKKFITK